MLVLITGIGVTGKSSLRRFLLNLLRNFGIKTEHYDADEFKILRNELDKDCLKSILFWKKDTIYLIEDVKFLEKDSFLPLAVYDLILYVKPQILSHIFFWLLRIWEWFLEGHYSWEKSSGWKGTGRKKDFGNVFPIVSTFMRDMRNRKKWIEKDLETISDRNYAIIRSVWTRKGPAFKV